MKKVIHLTVFALIAFMLSTASTHAQNIAATPFAVYLPLVQGDGAGSAATPTPTPGGDIYENPRDVMAIRREVIRLVNEYRVANGCPAATENPILMSAAQEWSVYMHANDYFQHSNTVNIRWYKDRGYNPTYGSLGENVALGYYTATNVLNGWKTSPAHNHLLLACHFAADGYVYDVGVGLEGLYWTLAIGERLN